MELDQRDSQVSHQAIHGAEMDHTVVATQTSTALDLTSIKILVATPLVLDQAVTATHIQAAHIPTTSILEMYTNLFVRHKAVLKRKTVDLKKLVHAFSLT